MCKSQRDRTIPSLNHLYPLLLLLPNSHWTSFLDSKHLPPLLPLPEAPVWHSGSKLMPGAPSSFLLHPILQESFQCCSHPTKALIKQAIECGKAVFPGGSKVPLLYTCQPLAVLDQVTAAG